jgi:hypothetical protein
MIQKDEREEVRVCLWPLGLNALSTARSKEWRQRLSAPPLYPPLTATLIHPLLEPSLSYSLLSLHSTTASPCSSQLGSQNVDFSPPPFDARL